MTQIMKCRVENILGVKEVEFAPDGKSITIGGGNGEGKSSAIWALIMALGGKGHIPPQPVRNGQKSGEVIVETEKYVVNLIVDADGKSKLQVMTPEGAKYSSPQTLLNECFGHLSFEPGAFIHMDKSARLKTLRELVGVDLSDLDKQEAELYEARRDCGYFGKTLAGRAEGLKYDEKMPGVEISVSNLLKQLQEYEAENAKAGALEGEKRRTKEEIEKTLSRISELKQEIGQLNKDHKKLLEIYEDIEKKEKGLRVYNIEPLKEEIEQSSETNAKIRANIEAKEILEELEKARVDYKKLDSEIQETREAKSKRLAEAKFPIDGLSFTEEGVTFNGIPFEQISESEQWEVSTAIGFALNKQGVLFVRNSGGLDKRSRARILERAKLLGVQVFLEVVDDAEDVQILIEEGEVKENRLTGETK